MTPVDRPPDPAHAHRRDYFERLYRHDPDPYGFRTRWYEARKRLLTRAALPMDHVGVVFEPGCGNGELTADLAAIADRVIAWDGDEHTLAQARRRCAALPHVAFDHGWVPHHWPAGPLDLIVLSEVGYFLSDGEIAALIGRVLATLAPHGTVLACHWRFPVEGFVLDGPAVHARLADGLAARSLHRLFEARDADFLLDVWSRDPRSVAQREGIR